MSVRRMQTVALTDRQARLPMMRPTSHTRAAMISVAAGSPDLAILPHWKELVARAPGNAFMNPVALKVASDLNFADVQVLTAWDEGAAPRRLVGLWALQRRRVMPLWPRQLEARPYYYAFLSTPVVDPAVTAEVVTAFLEAIRNRPGLPKVISLKEMDADSAAYAAIVAALARCGRSLELTRSRRPVVSRQGGVKASGSTRKKLRQDWNRLSAAGALQVVNDPAPPAVRAAFERFLELEQASWKGREGTALLCSARDAAFTQRLIGDLAEDGSASVALLELDGRAIAAQVLLFCGATAYTWKTAFDTDYARFSPGVLLIDKLTEQLLAGPVEAIDSCAAESSFMAQLWTGRRTMVDVVADVGCRPSLAFVLEATRQLGYEQARSLRNRLRSKARAPARPAAPLAPAAAPK